MFSWRVFCNAGSCTCINENIAHEFHLSVQDGVQEVGAHEERDADAEPDRVPERDGLAAGAEPQQGAAHHTGGCGTGHGTVRLTLDLEMTSPTPAFLRSGDGGGDGAGVGLLGGGQRSGPGGLLHVLWSGHREHEGAGPGPPGILRLPERSHHEAGGHHHLVSEKLLWMEQL